MASELKRDPHNLNQDWPMIVCKPERHALLYGNCSITATKQIQLNLQNEIFNLNFDIYCVSYKK